VPSFLPTDLNRDVTVNIIDISFVARAFSAEPRGSNMNEAADLNEDGIVNILDISMVARDHGRTTYLPLFLFLNGNV
jgi:hypothetical protein